LSHFPFLSNVDVYNVTARRLIRRGPEDTLEISFGCFN